MPSELTELRDRQAAPDPGRNSRLLYLLKRKLATPSWVIGAVLITVFFFLIVVPFFQIVTGTATWQAGDAVFTPGAQVGKFTLYYYQKLFASMITQAVLVKPFIHSITITFFVTIFGLGIGSILAWLVVRTDLPGRKLIGLFVPVTYMMPAWTLAFAWITLFKNRKLGGAPGLFEYIFHASPPDWVSYGPLPMIVVLTLHYLPFAYILVSAALTSLDSQLEETAEILGVSRWKILRRITFPLVLPALISAFALIFARTIDSFAAPSFLGLPVKYYTLSTMLYSCISSNRTSLGLILALLLIILATAAIGLSTLLVGKRKSYATISGMGTRIHLTKLGRAGTPILVLVCLFMLAFIVMPCGMLLYETFMLHDGNYSLSNFTLHYWIGQGVKQIAEGEPGLLHNTEFSSALWKSFSLALLTAGITGILGIFIGYAVSWGGKIGKVLDQITFLPFLIPGISFAAIYLVMFARPGPFWPALYGTFTLLVLVCVAKNITYASRSGSSSMMQIDRSLEEASLVLGIPWWQRFAKIIVPLARGGLISGFILAFTTMMRELDLIILLVTPANRTLTTLAYRFAEQSVFFQFMNAIAVVIIFVVFIMNAVASRFNQAKIIRSEG